MSSLSPMYPFKNYIFFPNKAYTSSLAIHSFNCSVTWPAQYSSTWSLNLITGDTEFSIIQLRGQRRLFTLGTADCFLRKLLMSQDMVILLFLSFSSLFMSSFCAISHFKLTFNFKNCVLVCEGRGWMCTLEPMCQRLEEGIQSLDLNVQVLVDHLEEQNKL